MQHRRLWSVGLLLTAFAGEVEGQEPRTELDRLVEEALVRNPDAAAALARWEAAREQPARVGSLPDPDFMTQVIRFRDRGFGVRGEGETWTMLRQEVPFPGKLGLRSEIARREADGAGEEYAALRLDLMEAVRIAYYQLLHAQLLEEVSVANRALVERTMEIARARYEVGSAQQQELLLARVEHSRIGNELAGFRRLRQTALADLNALLGRSGKPEFTAAAEADQVAPKLPLDVDSLTARALAQRPELARARLAAVRDTIALRLARKAYLPDLLVGAEYWVGHGESASSLPDERYVLDVGLTLPWIWRGKHDAAVREARAQLRASGYGFEETANQIRREVETTVAEVKAAVDQVRNFELLILPEASLNLESATEAYRTDRIGFLSLVDTQRSLNELRIAYHTVRVELLVARARLDRALGNPPLRVEDGGARAAATQTSSSSRELRR